MTAHELAKKLLEGPDLPVTIMHGYHAAEHGYAEVDEVDECLASLKKNDTYYYKVPHITLGCNAMNDPNSNP